jgi:hypothetical protein
MQRGIHGKVQKEIHGGETMIREIEGAVITAISLFFGVWPLVVFLTKPRLQNIYPWFCISVVQIIALTYIIHEYLAGILGCVYLVIAAVLVISILTFRGL